MPSTAGQGSAVALLSALPAAPSAEQLLAARSAAEFALQPVLQEQQAGDESQQQHASPEVAKQHGPQVLQLMQVLGTKLGSASDKGASRVLAELACSALHALDRLRKHMKAKGLELEAQRYNFVRRITMAGQFDLALQQGWCLRDALAAQVQAAATSPLPKELTDMQLACSLNLVVCTCELLDSGKSKGADNHISRVLPIFTDLVDVLRCGTACTFGHDCWHISLLCAFLMLQIVRGKMSLINKTLVMSCPQACWDTRGQETCRRARAAYLQGEAILLLHKWPARHSEVEKRVPCKV